MKGTYRALTVPSTSVTMMRSLKGLSPNAQGTKGQGCRGLQALAAGQSDVQRALVLNPGEQARARRSADAGNGFWSSGNFRLEVEPPP